MKLKHGMLLAAMTWVAGSAWADPTSPALLNLQAQIDALQQSLKSSLPKFPQVSSDAAMPFGAMPDTTLPLVFLKAKNGPLDAPLILGGEVELDTQYWDGNATAPQSSYATGTGSGTYVTTANLYTAANFNAWSQAMVQYSLTGNQTLGVPDAFINLGNLHTSPFYATVGHTYLPFGVFNDNGPWSNTLTTNLFRTGSTNELIAGWDNTNLNMNVGVYSNPEFRSQLSSYVLNINYGKTASNHISYDAGASYLSDVRGTNAALGGAYNTSPNSSGSASQPLNGGANPALDLSATVGIDAWGLAAEYISTLSHNLTVNNQPGSLMSTWDIGTTYNFNIGSIPTQYLLSYSATDHMDSIPMPLNGSAGASVSSIGGVKYQWLTSLDMQLVNNVFVGPEFAIERFYNGQVSSTATVDVSAFF